MKLTEREIEILGRIVKSEYQNGADEEIIGQEVWSVCESKSDNSVIGSLKKKGCAEVGSQDGQATCAITAAGFRAYKMATVDSNQPAAAETVTEAPKPTAQATTEPKQNKFVQQAVARGYADTKERYATRDGAKAAAEIRRQAGENAIYVTISTSTKDPSFAVFSKAGKAKAAKPAKALKLEKRAMEILAKQPEGKEADRIRKALAELFGAVVAVEDAR